MTRFDNLLLAAELYGCGKRCRDFLGSAGDAALVCRASL